MHLKAKLAEPGAHIRDRQAERRRNALRQQEQALHRIDDPLRILRLDETGRGGGSKQEKKRRRTFFRC
jgi:hypothetical protein